MNNSPENKRRLVLGLAGLLDIGLGVFIVLIALRIIPIFDGLPRWILYLLGGGLFTSGVFMALFNLSRQEN